MTTTEMKSVMSIALELEKRKQSIFKIIKRLGIEIDKKRDTASKNQFVAYVTQAEYQRIKEEISSRVRNPDRETQGDDRFADTDEMGVFYLIQLEPDHDTGRCKVGFAVNMQDRLRVHRCSAPFSKVIKKWPCKRLWEKTAIDCITSECERLHTEVFRARTIDEVIIKADAFFHLMPRVKKEQ